MSEKKQTEVVKVPEKVGFVVKAKEGFKKHKKAIIAGGLALGLGIFGLVKLMKKTGEDEEFDFNEDEDYIDVDAEEVEDDETID